MTEAGAAPRFAFGKNWQHFLGRLDDDRIAKAARSVQAFLPAASISGKTWLDIGSGSGLSSLVATRLGCSRVHSFDYDTDSVECTREMKRRYFADAPHWCIERGSVLDRDYLDALGTWDIVYAWGVLHHTGSMWTALGNAADRVSPGGLLWIAIYNDQGGISVRWRKIKSLYNRSRWGRALVLGTCIPYFALRGLVGDLLRRQDPTRRYRNYRQGRGMSVLHDWIDWLGGSPFEVATPEAILDFYRPRGFVLERLKTCGGSLGCNEFLFRKE
ncbi:MAG TPA: class I SAM-dependent methyltransferase [Candidatus Krumholzibacteria bacterium]|nr:class I SAM-dependent methyltransferase [Candidatus Krumholzibacteria bacterium]